MKKRYTDIDREQNDVRAFAENSSAVDLFLFFVLIPESSPDYVSSL